MQIDAVGTTTEQANNSLEGVPDNRHERGANTAQEAIAACKGEQATNESEQGRTTMSGKMNLAAHSEANDRAIADDLAISTSIANTLRKQIE
jgi:hypothetical protein